MPHREGERITNHPFIEIANLVAGLHENRLTPRRDLVLLN